jgi:hypothetical protein
MGYLSNSTKAASLTVGGVDYTDKLVSFNVSDSSAFRAGLISTTGALILGQVFDELALPDYGRSAFKRGAEVVLSIEVDGNVVRHPRGLLYVISQSYNVESMELSVEIGCRLSLATLTGDVDELLPLVPITLEPLREDYNNISGSFATAGQYLFQNNQGALVSGDWFGSDGFNTADAPSFVSVLGLTVLNAAPLVASGAIPDSIGLGYSYPVNFAPSGEKYDQVITETEYYLPYPAVRYERTGTLSDIINIGPGQVVSSVTSSCGNTPPPPANSQRPPSCSEGYEVQQMPIILPAFRIQEDITEYYAVGGQVSRQYSQTRGPAVEASSQYYADEYAYCRYTWATQCNPNGSCSYDNGMQEILLGYSETINEYGSAGELVKSITDVYADEMSAAQPQDWRAGVVNGAPTGFRPMYPGTMYRSQRTEVVYRKEGEVNIQETTQWTSPAAKGSGISSGDIDALLGERVFTRRSSATISTLPLTPDSLGSPQVAVTTESTVVPLYSNAFESDPDEAGPYQSQEQVPVPLLMDSREEVEEALQSYQTYLAKFTRGNATGLALAEAVREDIITDWVPGQPLRYYDSKADKLVAMRANACSWSVTQEEAVVAFEGITLGASNGTLRLPSNIVGNSKPDGTPQDTVQDWELLDETYVDYGFQSYVIDVNLTFRVAQPTPTLDYVYFPAAKENPVEHNQTLVVFVTGILTTTGGFVDPTPGGGIPSDLYGSLVTDIATVLDADMFS